MRIEIIFIIICLIAAGGVGVDDYYVRQGALSLLDQKQQAERQYAAANLQVEQLTSGLKASQAQTSQCVQEKSALFSRIAVLAGQGNEAGKQPAPVQAAAPVTGQNPLIPYGAGGVLAVITSAGGLLTIKKIRHAQPKRPILPVSHPQTISVRVSQKELALLVERRRKNSRLE